MAAPVRERGRRPGTGVAEGRDANGSVGFDISCTFQLSFYEHFSIRDVSKGVYQSRT